MDWKGPRLEIYDHYHSIRHHGYDEGGGTYQEHTAQQRSKLAAERLDLARTRWSVETTVVSAQPGHVFELQNADIHDDRYLIISMSSTGMAGEHAGEYTNSLRVIPTRMPYRPAPIERPLMPGPETATVVGPPGEEIHTDKHGRIKVQFHWDRQGQKDAHSSAWIRVSQAWAGPGWGFLFIPRIGMEVIVSFLGGDPDRPIVTGCVYNGANPTPYTLPDEKTKSTIKTNSSLGGGGSNELRFEDKKGSEEIYIHAQKDFNEVVENNHSTHVKNCQTNTVDVNQTETIGNNQTLTVKKDRKKSVDGNETTFIGGGETPGNRTETVWGHEDVVINQNRTHTVIKDETLLVEEGKRTVTVKTGKNIETYQGGRETTVTEFDKLTVDANRTTHVTGKYSIKSDGQYKVLQNSVNELTINDSLFAAMVGRVQLKAGDGVHYDAMPDGTLKLAAAGISPALVGVQGLRLEQYVLAAAIAMKRGDGATAIAYQREACRIAFAANAQREAVILWMVVAGYELALGRETNAEQEYRGVAEYAASAGFPLERAQAGLALALIAARRGMHADAAREYSIAADAALAAGATGLAIECWRLTGHMASELGLHERAAECWLRAIELAEGSEPNAARVSSAPRAARELVQLLRARGQTAQATALEHQANRIEEGDTRAAREAQV